MNVVSWYDCWKKCGLFWCFWILWLLLPCKKYLTSKKFVILWRQFRVTTSKWSTYWRSHSSPNCCFECAEESLRWLLWDELVQIILFHSKSYFSFFTQFFFLKKERWGKSFEKNENQRKKVQIIFCPNKANKW